MIELETSRLIMRPIIAKKDNLYLYELNIDPEVTKYTGNGPFDSEEDCFKFYSEYNQYEKYKMGRFSVFLKKDDSFLGWCGLKKGEDGLVDLGFRFFKKHWNNGYATEAVKAILIFGFELLKLNKISATHLEENTSSGKVMIKNNMIKEGVLKDHTKKGAFYRSLVQYRLTREEFRNLDVV